VTLQIVLVETQHRNLHSVGRRSAHASIRAIARTPADYGCVSPARFKIKKAMRSFFAGASRSIGCVLP
jgi:hypothetical protein